MLAPIRSALTAVDLAVCHLETPLAADDRHVSGYPTFNAPPELADAIHATGYDSCSVASNHAMDQGPRGVAATLGALDRVGVGHAGTARSAAEATRPEIHVVNGVQVGLLAYTYGLNGGDTRPAGQPWLVNLISPRRILADAHATKRAGAQFVAVSLHWGTQYQVAPTAGQRALARALLASPTSTCSSAATPMWCSRSSGSGTSTCCTGWAISCPTSRPAAVPQQPRTG